MYDFDIVGEKEKPNVENKRSNKCTNCDKDYTMKLFGVQLCEKCSKTDKYAIISDTEAISNFNLESYDLLRLNNEKNKYLNKTIYKLKDVIDLSNYLACNIQKRQKLLDIAIKNSNLIIDPNDFSQEINHYLRNGFGRQIRRLLEPYKRKKELMDSLGNKYDKYKNDPMIKEAIISKKCNIAMIKEYVNKKDRLVAELNSGKYKFNYNIVIRGRTEINPTIIVLYLLYNKPTREELLNLFEKTTETYSNKKGNKNTYYYKHLKKHHSDREDIESEEENNDIEFDDHLILERIVKEIEVQRNYIKRMMVRQKNVQKKLDDINKIIEKLENGNNITNDERRKYRLWR
jgi:hypothetical protein